MFHPAHAQVCGVADDARDCAATVHVNWSTGRLVDCFAGHLDSNAACRLPSAVCCLPPAIHTLGSPTMRAPAMATQPARRLQSRSV